MKKNLLFFLFVFGLHIANAQHPDHISVMLFNDNWQFLKNADTSINNSFFNRNNKTLAWQPITLPHTANIEPVIKKQQQWQGICYYRKFFMVNNSDKQKHIAIRIDAAMNLADVYLNGKYLMTHKGGYLPLYIDLTNKVRYGTVNCLLIRLNNEDNPEIPPGKPIKDLDFNFYSGIYRNAWFIRKNKTYITDAVNASKVNGGGILAHFDNVSTDHARLNIKVEVRNDNANTDHIQFIASLYDPSGTLVRKVMLNKLTLNAHTSQQMEQYINIKYPLFWSPEHPRLYKLSIEIKNKEGLIDSASLKTGIRQIAFKTDGFYLNGSKYLLRGTNRHQEYPYIGYALSDNAQYRDAWKIKEAGFNFVRCSHYPPSPAFLAACDELGIFVMDSTPGWQFFGDNIFQQNSFQNITDMIHRDRNHPAIILWEGALNETNMSHGYMERAHEIVHHELPYSDTYTCGWINDVYDVFIPARQHAKAPYYWKKFNSKPILIAEYGDWEYYAQNAGFNQTQYKDLTAEEKTSRQLRTDGEKRLLQQALNFQEAHNDNLNGQIAGDLNWIMFDYKRGYAPDIESSGIMDIFRLPKFSYYFYQSQRDIGNNKPTLFIASYWNDAATKNVRVYSNCDKVELFLNGQSMGRQKPDTGRTSSSLNHAPFTFPIKKYQAGVLTATGYINGKKVVYDKRATPGKPCKIILKIDESGKQLKSNCNDAVFIYAYITDDKGTLVPYACNQIMLSLKGDGEVIGKTTVSAEAGIAAFLVKAGHKKDELNLSATAKNFKTGNLSIMVK